MNLDISIYFEGAERRAESGAQCGIGNGGNRAALRRRDEERNGASRGFVRRSLQRLPLRPAAQLPNGRKRRGIWVSEKALCPSHRILQPSAVSRFRDLNETFFIGDCDEDSQRLVRPATAGAPD